MDKESDWRLNWPELVSLVVITSPGKGAGHIEIVEGALRAGCKSIQVRDKEMSDREFSGLARRAMEVCWRSRALLFVNDRIDVAMAVGCDGVHLGADDLDLADARSLVPPGMLLGYSPEDLEDGRRAVERGADYLGAGPVFVTSSKMDAGPPIGLDGLASYCELGVPVVGVGGINEENATSVLASGAAGVAVLSAVAREGDIEARTGKIVERIETWRNRSNKSY